jgi:hypothetical protein
VIWLWMRKLAGRGTALSAAVYDSDEKPCWDIVIVSFQGSQKSNIDLESAS